MRKEPISLSSLAGVFAVPPLGRRNDAHRTIDFAENQRIIAHIVAGGITRLVYGGNAVLSELTLLEYERLLDWLSTIDDRIWCIPSAGPSYGRAMDQAPLLRKHGFPAVMVLPSNDPRDAAGLERGLREIADAAATPLIAYCRDESNFGSDRDAGLEAIGRLVQDGVCVAVKYGITRDVPAEDSFLTRLSQHLPASRIVSGIGEEPGLYHIRGWNLPGFTSGLACIAPHLSSSLFQACATRDFAAAEDLCKFFLPLEQARKQKGPVKVLHAAVGATGVASTGALPPYQACLTMEESREIRSLARQLLEHERAFSQPRHGIKAETPPSARI